MLKFYQPEKVNAAIYSASVLKKGYTLIELMIVLVIAGILITITYPSYRTHILRSHRVEAQTTLALDQIILEQCYEQNFSYEACASLPNFPHNSVHNYYRIVLANLSETTFTLTAIALGTQTLDIPCASISVDQANQRSSNDSSGNNQTVCW